LCKERNKRRFSSGEVYNMYRRVCNLIDMDPLTQRRVTDFVSELDILGLINAVIVSKGRYGRTKEIVLSIPSMQVRAAIQEDYSIGNLEVLALPPQLTFA
jgi:cell division control protein 6